MTGHVGLNRDDYRAAAAPKALRAIPEAGHVGGFAARPRQYEARVVGFLDRALLVSRGAGDRPRGPRR